MLHSGYAREQPQSQAAAISGVDDRSDVGVGRSARRSRERPFSAPCTQPPHAAHELPSGSGEHPRPVPAHRRSALIARYTYVRRSPRSSRPQRERLKSSGMATSGAVACQAAAIGAQRVAQRRASRPAAVPAAAPCRRRQQQRRLAVAATAAPPATGSPFAAVQNEEQLFGLLKAGASSGTVGAGARGRGARHDFDAASAGCPRHGVRHGCRVILPALRHVGCCGNTCHAPPCCCRCRPASSLPSTSCTPTTRCGSRLLCSPAWDCLLFVRRCRKPQFLFVAGHMPHVPIMHPCAAPLPPPSWWAALLPRATTVPK